jgi:integrase
MAYLGKYETKQGTKWQFKIFTGLDPQTGKKKYVTRRGFETKKEANHASIKYASLADQNKLNTKKDKHRFKDVYLDWYEIYKNTVRESTWNRTDGMFQNHILPAFGEKWINTITTRDVQTAVNKWFTSTTANYKRWFNYTSSVMEYAIKQEYMTKNPCKNVILPHNTGQYEETHPNFWSKEQLNKFLGCIDRKNDLDIYTMFRVLAYTGCRRGELLALEWKDFSSKDKTLRIDKTLTQGEHGKQIVQQPKTRNSKRTITLDDGTVSYLERWHHEQHKQMLYLGYNTLNPHQLIFCNKKNGYHSLNTPAKRLKKIIKDNDLKPAITIHGFRHSHISALLSAGVPITTVQLRMGHASPEVTLGVYSHITEQQSRDAVNIFANYLAN